MTKYQTNFTGEDAVAKVKIDGKPAVDETDFGKLAEDTVSDEKVVKTRTRANAKKAVDDAEKTNAANAKAIEVEAEKTVEGSTPKDPA